MPLKLGHAKFRVSLAPLDEPAGQGLERVAFEVATVEGAAVRRADENRFGRRTGALLARLESRAGAKRAAGRAGVRRSGSRRRRRRRRCGGERLQRLAQTTQVLLVTHSPQVAARAERHFRITRKGDKMAVELLDAEARLEEVARMLSGAAVTEEARAAARRLLAEAHMPPKKTRKRA